MDGLRDLNERQREAVLTLTGPLLVLAGAGTGKTRVITYRMAELIRRGTAPERILSVTFTNKAAREMQERTAALLTGNGRGRGSSERRGRRKPLVTTFHSLCVRILREEARILGYPTTFAIYDRGDQESAARAALREIRVTDKTLRPAELVNRIGRWKTQGVMPQEAREHVENDLDFLAATAYRRYQQSIKSRGAVDFDDLLLLVKRLFSEFPDVLARHQSRFDHVQIDEYQDTNGIQFALIEALVRRHRSICVVGDDDQSIYGWRGAEVRHILEFDRIFPGAKVVRLEENYRSNPAILDLANRLAAHNPGRHEKVLVSSKPSGSNASTGAGAVRFLPFEDEQTEAASVVSEIADRIAAGVSSPGDIAILFRTNEQPRLFESELRRRRVRYVLIGGQSFYDRREIRDLLAYLKVLVRPADEQSLLRIINTPPRGIGDTTVEKLTERAVRTGPGTSLWEVIPDAQAAGEIPAKALAGLSSLRTLFERFRGELERTSTGADRTPGGSQNPRLADSFRPLPPGEGRGEGVASRSLHLANLFNRLLSDIGYEAEIERRYDTPEERLARMAAIGELREAIKTYEARAPTPSLAGFLDDSALLGRDDDFESDEDKRVAEADAVKLMTLHSAKGLEFPSVYLVGLEEGFLPHRRSLVDAEGSIAEERRLAYVGITRAMTDLTITWAESRTKWGKRTPTIVSRFINEMRGACGSAEDHTEETAANHDSPTEH